MSESDRDVVRRTEGLFVGLLTDDEAEAFNRCVQGQFAFRSYEGAGGFLGLAKVRLCEGESRE